MLQQMREWFRWLKWLLVIIIVMFIWWAVATWGGGASGLRRSEDWAARVNGTPIAALAFQSYARQIDSTYQSLLGDQYAQQRAFIGIGRQAMGQLVEEELVYQEATRLGIGASPGEVARAITRDPNFLENGQFIGLERYRNLFQRSRLSIEDYEAQVQRRLILNKYRSLIEDGVTVTDGEVEQEWERRNQKATVDYLVVDPARLGPRPQPSEADAQSYYESHRDRYSQGEGRKGIYVLWNAGELAAGQTVTDEEVQAAYERDRASRFTEPAQRRASHILFKVDAGASAAAAAKIEAKARRVLKQARAGADFAGLARKFSEDGTASAGGDLNFFGRGQMVKEFEDAAFGTPVGGISDLVRTSYGFHIIKVTEAKEPRSISLEEARDGIRSELRLARARADIAKRSADFARTAAGGKLETVAKSQGLPTSETGAVHQGEALPALAASQAVVARMFALSPGQVSDPVPIASGTVVVQVSGTTPPEPKPFASVRAQVEKDLNDERGRAAVADQIRSVEAKGGGLKELALRLKSEVRTQSDLAQGALPPGVPPDAALERQIKALPRGRIGEPVVTASGIVVLSVKDRKDNREELESQRDATRDSMVRQRQDRLYRALMKRLKEQARIEINEPLVRALDQG